MYEYDLILEELNERVECGELTLEEAELINDYAYDKYVIESPVAVSSVLALLTAGTAATVKCVRNKKLYNVSPLKLCEYYEKKHKNLIKVSEMLTMKIKVKDFINLLEKDNPGLVGMVKHITELEKEKTLIDIWRHDGESIVMFIYEDPSKNHNPHTFNYTICADTDVSESDRLYYTIHFLHKKFHEKYTEFLPKGDIVKQLSLSKGLFKK